MKSKKTTKAETEPVSFKCIIAGNGTVGKTCLLRRYTHGDFTMKTAPTTGSDFVPKNVQKDGSSLKINFWDCAGQQRYQQVVKTFFRGSHGALLVFDVSNKDSFKELENWLRSILKEAKSGIAVVVVGNKSDLRKDSMKPETLVTEEEIKEFLDENQGVNYIECSALENTNVNSAFQLIIDKMYEKFYQEELAELSSRVKKPMKLGKDKEGGDVSGKCC